MFSYKICAPTITKRKFSKSSRNRKKSVGEFKVKMEAFSKSISLHVRTSKTINTVLAEDLKYILKSILLLANSNQETNDTKDIDNSVDTACPISNSGEELLTESEKKALSFVLMKVLREDAKKLPIRLQLSHCMMILTFLNIKKNDWKKFHFRKVDPRNVHIKRI